MRKGTTAFASSSLGIDHAARRRRQCIFAMAALLIIGAVAGAVHVWRTVRSPDSALLMSWSGAQWIVDDGPLNSMTYKVIEQSVVFRRTITLTAVPPRAVLSVKGFRQCSVTLGSQNVPLDTASASGWQQAREVDLAPFLRLGEQRLIIRVSNDRGPPALWAQCADMNLVTDWQWESSANEFSWKPVWLANKPRQPAFLAALPSSGTPLLATSAVWLPVMVITALAVRLARSESRLARLAQPSTVRWMLMAAWIVLGVNNLFRLPPYVAFDALAHMTYIDYIVTNRRLPLAGEGWQMFQSPLYYMVCAPIYAAVPEWINLNGRATVVRIVPILCGLGMIEILRRALRRAFPDRHDLQSLGLVFGTMLPMNVYISQMVGNEPMVGVMSAWVILLALSLSPELARNRRFALFIAIGIALGLALLSKATAILLVPIITIWLALSLWSHGATILRVAWALGCVVGTATLLAGWYYARNIMVYGKAFVSGWDPVRGIAWWQDPGYRTIGEFFRFGHALSRPIYAAHYGYWDALYSTMWTDGYLSGLIAWPPWNEHFHLAGSPLGLIPTALLVLGIVALLCNPLRPGRAPLLLSVACLAFYLTATIQLYMELPIYSTVKASYLMGITPCLAIIAMSGAKVVMTRHWSKAIICGLLIGWAVNVYCTYFIARTYVETPLDPRDYGQAADRS